MPYSMIIVDDEKIIRMGLEKYITECSLGFEVSGTFEDGKDAIEYLKNNKVDVVFTDIRMFEVSGLELAEYVHKTSPDTVIVFLSGYKDFEYAQHAMKNNVLYYLLKPIENEEISNVLEAIRKKLDTERINKAKVQRFDEIIKLRRDKFFSDFLFRGFEDAENCKENFEKLEFSFSYDDVYCSILDIKVNNDISDKWIYGKEKFHTMIENYFLICNDACSYSLFLDETRCIILSDNPAICDNEYSVRLKEWLYSFCGISAKVENIYTCKGIYNLCKYFVFDKNSEENGEEEWIMNSKYRMLNTYLTLNMIDDAKKIFEVIVFEHDTGNYIHAVKIIKELCEKIPYIGENNKDEKYVNMLGTVPENGDYSTALKNIFAKMVSDIRDANKNEDALVIKIKEYIQENYADDITLEDIADNVFLNSVYLSKYFKKHVGETFTDYLLGVRIVNAIKLLKEGKYKVYEISEMVGYKSSRFFSKQFKNYTGYTPKAYLKNIWNKDIFG